MLSSAKVAELVKSKECVVQDFGPFCYLEMQKSGSTFVNHFLQQCSLLEVRKHRKHAPINDEYSDNTFYFITVRHPLALYSSLFRFGRDSRGDLFNRLKSKGLAECYSSFGEFVEFVRNPRNASHLGSDYNERIAEQIGFMSFRFLKLSLKNPMQQIYATLADGGRILELEKNFITGLEIKNEALLAGLEMLSTGHLSKYFDQEKVSSFLVRRERVNASTSTHESLAGEAEELSSMLEREDLLFSRYRSTADR